MLRSSTLLLIAGLNGFLSAAPHDGKRIQDFSDEMADWPVVSQISPSGAIGTTFMHVYYVVFLTVSLSPSLSVDEG